MKLRAYIAALHAALFAILLAISPAGSGSMTLLGAGKPAAGGGGGGFALAYQGSAVNGGAGPVLTYACGAFAGGATRTVVAILFYGSTVASGISGVKIDGISLTQVSSAWAKNATSVDRQADVWISSASLSAGAGSVEVTYGANNSYHSAVAIYNLTTATVAPGTPATFVETSGATTITAGPVNIPPGGGALFASFMVSGATQTVGSGNAALDAQPTSGGAQFNFGHTTATGASVSVTLNNSGTDGGPMTLVPWGP